MSSRSLTAVCGLLCLAAPAAFLTGCALETTSLPSPVQGFSISGSVYGGIQPLINAHVYLFSPGTAGYGMASQSLLTAATTGQSDSIGAYVLTDSKGSFSVSSDYTCPTASSPVYLYALGGQPNGGPANAAAGFLYVFPTCSGDSSSPVTLNEITTVASAYAMAGFATDATHVSSSNSALAQTGLANAFSAANNIVNMSAGTTRTTTNAGANGTVPALEIGTLADMLAACVNSNGAVTGPTTPTPCYTLFNNAQSNGTSGTIPTDTATAAINIAHHPGAAVTALYGLQTGIGAPYTGLSAAPKDLSLQVSYTGGGLGLEYSQRGLAIDASGNLYVVNSEAATLNSTGTSISKFSNLGVPANSTGYTSLGLNLPLGIAINAASTDVWIASYNNDLIVDFNIALGTGTSHSVTSGFGPGDLTIDANGNIWSLAVNNADSSPAAPNRVVKMTPSGATTYYTATNGLYDPYAIAATSGTNGYVWVANDAGTSVVSLFGLGTSSNKTVANHPSSATDVSIDASGKGWFVTGGDTSPVWSVPAGGGTAVGYSAPVPSGNWFIDSDVLDGAGNVWFTTSNVTDYYNGGTVNNALNRILAVTNTGTSLTGTSGFVPEPQPANPTTTEGSEPNCIAVDGSGNVWYTSNSDPTLHEIVGAAVPVVTPIAAGVVNGTLATRP